MVIQTCSSHRSQAKREDLLGYGRHYPISWWARKGKENLTKAGICILAARAQAVPSASSDFGQPSEVTCQSKSPFELSLSGNQSQWGPTHRLWMLLCFPQSTQDASEQSITFILSFYTLFLSLAHMLEDSGEMFVLSSCVTGLKTIPRALQVDAGLPSASCYRLWQGLCKCVNKQVTELRPFWFFLWLVITSIIGVLRPTPQKNKNKKTTQTNKQKQSKANPWDMG